MTVYNATLDTQIDPDAPATSLLMYQMRDNPIAISEGSNSAPYMQTYWHPYDSAVVGDTGDGVIYDFAVDGAVSSIETPTFADGYEYQIVYVGISPLAGTPSINLELYRETSAAYSAVDAVLTFTAFARSGIIEFHKPRIVSSTMFFEYLSSIHGSDTIENAGFAYRTIKHTVAQKVSKARISLSSSTFSAGKFYLFRRRVYVPA